MAEITQTGKIALVNYTTAEWQAETRIPFKGCACVEFTADGKTKLKIGDGANLFAELPYVADELTAALIIAALGYTPLDSSKLGVAEGAASLDASGKIPTTQLPSYVDDVIEVDGIDNAPITGESDKIYVDTVSNKTYRWSGTAYVEISASDIVTASDQNGYIKINGTDVKVYEPEAIDTALSETSENAVQNKVITAALANKIDKSDTLVLNCTL